MKHVEDVQLERYAFGIADPTERILFETHLHHCEVCQDKIQRFHRQHHTDYNHKSVGVSQDILQAIMEEIDKMPSEPQIDQKYLNLFPPSIHPDLPPDSQWEWTTMWPSRGKSARMVVDTTSGHSLYCIYFEGGASTPEHHHLAKEETVILQGAYSYGNQTAKKGDYDVALPGTQHAPQIHTGEDCWCLVRVANDAPFKFVGKSIWRQPLYRIAQWSER